MREIANRFSDQMDRICHYIDFIIAAIKLTKVPREGLRFGHGFVVAASSFTDAVQKIGNFTIAAYDGAYLTACAEYELGIREFIETYTARVADKCHDYHHLPKDMREWYPEGCARLILSIEQDKYRHLTKDTVIGSLASCVRPSKSKRYTLLGEAFSYNERNFSPPVVDECFKRLGIDKIWQKLSREVCMQHELGTRNHMTTEQRAKSKLSELIQRRNDIRDFI